MGMGDGRPKFCWLVAFAFAFAFFATNANSQEPLDPLLHPGTRFMRENVEIETLAYWQGSIGVQFIGIGSQPTRQKILSEVFALASAARLDIEVFGFSNAMFEESAIAKASRVDFMEFDAELQPFIENGRGDQMALGEIDLSDANPAILSILDQGLVKQVDGCYSRWKASKENEIEAIIVAASTSIPEESRKECLWGLVPSVFGISTLVSQYDAAKAVGANNGGETVIFDDRSELALALSAAAVCRLDLGDFGYVCPFLLIKEVFAHHAFLAPWKVN